MYIQEIEWMNRSILEAVLVVSDGEYNLTCFACPCQYSIGDCVNGLLECLDVSDVQTSGSNATRVTRKGKGFQYAICGCLNNFSKGIVQVGKLKLHICPNRIPKDIYDGQFIQFSVERIDLY